MLYGCSTYSKTVKLVSSDWNGCSIISIFIHHFKFQCSYWKLTIHSYISLGIDRLLSRLLLSSVLDLFTILKPAQSILSKNKHSLYWKVKHKIATKIHTLLFYYFQVNIKKNVSSFSSCIIIFFFFALLLCINNTFLYHFYPQ